MRATIKEQVNSMVEIIINNNELFNEINSDPDGIKFLAKLFKLKENVNQ